MSHATLSAAPAPALPCHVSSDRMTFRFWSQGIGTSSAHLGSCLAWRSGWKRPKDAEKKWIFWKWRLDTTGMKQPSRPGTSPTGKAGTIFSESLGILASRSCNTIITICLKRFQKRVNACEISKNDERWLKPYSVTVWECLGYPASFGGLWISMAIRHCPLPLCWHMQTT